MTQSKILLLTLTINVIVFQTFSEPAYAQISEFKITASDADTMDRFGYSVSISDSYAVIGSVFDDNTNGIESGSAYVFKRSDTSWVQQAKLLPSDGEAGEQFGYSVSIFNDYTVVGSRLDDDNGKISGSAYVFKRSGINWTQEVKLLPSNGTADDEFGFAVSISGDYAVVGATHDDDNGINAGAAYIFKRSGTSWTQEAKLLASDGNASDQFGFSVSISGDHIVVGAAFDEDNGSDAGSAYVFKRTGTSWAQEAKLLASDGEPIDEFGISVSISGDYVVVGAPLANTNRINEGSAYVFKRIGTSWTQEAKLLASDGMGSDNFGFSVSISGDYAIVGAAYNNFSGSAYVFKRTGTSWAQEAKLLASDGEPSDEFGWSVSISQENIVVGAYRNEEDGEDIYHNAGSAYIFNGFAPVVGVESEGVGLPEVFSLSQNYPNPFNPLTTIRYALPAAAEVLLAIYNIRGEEVTRLVNGEQPAGNYQVSWDASNVASGLYIYRLTVGEFTETKKMILMK